MTMYGFAPSGRALHAVRAVLHREIVTCTRRSAASVLKDTLVVNWKDVGGLIPQDRNIIKISPRATTPVRTGTGPSAPPISIGSQKIGDPRGAIIPKEVMSADPLNASIDIIPSKHRDPTPTWIEVIGSKFINKSITNIYAHIRMNFASDTVFSKSPNFMDLGLSSVDTTDELRSVFTTTTRIDSENHESYWILRSLCISKSSADRVSSKKEKNHYNIENDF